MVSSRTRTPRNSPISSTATSSMRNKERRISIALSRLQTDYMQTQAAFSGGALPMPSTWQWNQATPDKPGHFQIVVTLCKPPVSALASDLGLLQAGWQTGTTRMVAHLLISA